MAAFAREFATRDWRRLEPHLDETVTFALTDFPTLVGLQSVLDLWRRKFRSYGLVTFQIERLITQDRLVIAQQTLRVQAASRPPVAFDSMSVYEVRDGLIVSWDSHLDVSPSRPDLVLWRNLRRARW